MEEERWASQTKQSLVACCRNGERGSCSRSIRTLAGVNSNIVMLLVFYIVYCLCVEIEIVHTRTRKRDACTQTDTQTDKQTNRHTNRQTDTHTHTRTQRRTYRLQRRSDAC